MQQLAGALEAATRPRHHRARHDRSGRRAARRRRGGRVGRGRPRPALAAGLRDPAPPRRRARARRERRAGRPRARAAHDPARRRHRARRRAARARRAADQLHESRRPHLHRVPASPRSAGRSGCATRWRSRGAASPRLLGRPSSAAPPVSTTSPRSSRRATPTTGDDVTAELHDAVDALDDGDGETFAFVQLPARPVRRRDRDERQPRGRVLPRGGRARRAQGLPRRASTKMRKLIDDVADAIVAGTIDLDAFSQWETTEPLRPILRAAITGEPERIASAILPNDDLMPALPADCAVEVSAVASADGIAGDRTDDLPLAFTATLQHEVADPAARRRRRVARLARRRAAGAARSTRSSARRAPPKRSSPTTRPRTPTSGPRSPDQLACAEHLADRVGRCLRRAEVHRVTGMGDLALHALSTKGSPTACAPRSTRALRRRSLPC